jgi:hypothetical protein
MFHALEQSPILPALMAFTPRVSATKSGLSVNQQESEQESESSQGTVQGANSPSAEDRFIMNQEGLRRSGDVNREYNDDSTSNDRQAVYADACPSRTTFQILPAAPWIWPDGTRLTGGVGGYWRILVLCETPRGCVTDDDAGRRRA